MTAISDTSGIIEPVCLEHGSTFQKEPALGIFGNLVCCICLVQDDHGQNIICSSANPAVDVVLDLTVQNSGVGTLGCQDQVNTKRTALSCNRTNGKVITYSEPKMKVEDPAKIKGKLLAFLDALSPDVQEKLSEQLEDYIDVFRHYNRSSV